MRSVKSEYNFGLLHCRLASRCKGVTLVELIVAFSLIVIIFAAVVPQFRAIRISWAGAETAASIIQNGRVLSEHITRNLSAASKVISVSLASQVQGYITFTDANEDSYRYMYSGGYVVFGSVGSEEQLAGPVSRFQITCYSIDPSFAATTDTNDIRYVEIETDFTNSDPLGTDKTFKTGVLLRTNLNDDCGIVGYWKLNDGSGNIAADSSGYGNHGTLVNMEEADWVDGRINGGLDPDGGNEYVNCRNDASLDITSGITISLWVNADSFSNEPDLITKGLYNEAYTIWLKPDDDDPSFGQVVFALNNNRFYSSPAITTNEWYHIAVTRGGNEWKIYINGHEDASGIYGTAIGTTSRALTFSSTGYDYDGTLDDIRIYNRALNPDEIIQLANSVVFRSFEEAKSLGNTTSLTISTPNDVNEDDLLIAAVAVDGDVSSSLSPPGGEGWTEIDVDDYSSSTEIPSITHDNSGRQCLIGFTVNKEPSSDAVGIIGTWDTGTTHDKIDGTNRALLFFAHAETSRTLNSVTYGGQEMTEVIDRDGGSGSSETYVAAFILDEDGINAASGTTFIPNWSSYPGSNVTYSSVFLENVDQSDLYGDTSGSTTYDTDITTSALAVSKGDMVIEAAACSSSGTYTMNNGFTKAFDLDTSSYYDGLGGYKSAGGAVTLGAWWKLADVAGTTSHQFTWSGSKQAYGWIMCFAGHDEADPINAFSTGNDSDDTPTSPSVDPDAINCMILRLGAFDNGDIMVYPEDDSSLPDEHFPITMDRSVTVLFEDGFEGTPWDAQWTTDWERDNYPVYSGDYSANGDRSDSVLTSDNINTSSYSSFVVSFWYRQYHIESDDDVYLQFYDGSEYDNIFNLNDSTEDWNYYTTTVTEAQYIRSNFRIRFTANMNSSEEGVWIDDIAVYGSGGVCGGAGYRIQDVAGASGTSNFSLGAPNEARMITVAVKPGALCEEPCCGETIKP
ncbi:MAG: hypothetical protein A2173_08240 [Planctomycetes bacterium RBG_13_44_8b]|nr:MAG: hypothetical protein A2173_08240 [Planctomycetes bacterium RBG_13_44_8b]